MIDRILGGVLAYVGLAGLFVLAGVGQALLMPHAALPRPQDTVAVVGFVMIAPLVPIIFVGALIYGLRELFGAAK